MTYDSSCFYQANHFTFLNARLFICIMELATVPGTSTSERVLGAMEDKTGKQIWF